LGIGYKLIKWAVKAHPTLILYLFQNSLHLRYHPWTTAKVVIILKPGKPDYLMAKAYHPIFLLECYGKLLEK
jgi:hypothetical protein